MNHLKSFGFHILLKAFVPFFFTLWISSQTEEVENPSLLFNQDQDLKNDRWLKSIIMGLASSLDDRDRSYQYVQFLVLALLFHLITKVISKITERLKMSSQSEEDVSIPDQKEPSSTLYRGQGLIYTITCLLKYTLAYCFYLFLGLCLVSFFSSGLLQSPQLLSSPSSPYRVLEQQQNETFQGIASPEIRPNLTEKQLASLSLSVGTVLGSLNFDYYSLALSNDGKLVFASLKGAGKVNIIDISNLQAPHVIGVISLTVSRNYYNLYLKLSPDGKTLFASNFQYLEIVDVTNVNSPKILSKTPDPNVQQKDSGIYFLPQVYQMSMAFSGDGKILFVGGLGLQIFNISDMTNPQLSFSTRPDLLKYELPITSVAMSSDGNTLFYANGTLNIMRAFGPNEPKTLGSYSSRGPIVSAMLSPDAKIAYVTLSGIEEKVIIEKLDVSDIENPRKIKEYELRIPSARLQASVFMTATPAFSHLFLSVDISDWISEIVTFNLMSESFLDMHNSLVKAADSLVFSADDRILFTTSEHLFEIIELKFDYPNSRTFSLSENLIFDLKTQNCLTSMGLSRENRLLFTVEGCGDNAELVIYDIQNTSSPKILSSSLINNTLSSSSNITISNDNKRVFISTQLTLSVWDTSDLSSPKPLNTFTVGAAEEINEYTTSSDGNYVFFFWKNHYDSMTLKILNFSAPDEFREIPVSILSGIPLGARLALSNDNRLLYILGKEGVEAYDISEISSPVKRFSMSYHDEGQPVSPKSFGVSSDNKILVISLQDSILEKIHIYDISDPENPQFKSEFTRPKSGMSYTSCSPVFSSDLTKVYLMQPNGLITVNITNLEKPKIASTFSISNDSIPSDFLIFADNRIGFIRADGNRIKIISLETPYTVFLNRESFYLGERYAGNVILFGRPDQKTYIPIEEAEHRFLKAAILDIRVAQTEKNTKQILSPLPYWMSFDKENSVITIEAKKQLDLGVYSLYTAFSNQVPLDAFYQVEAIKNGSVPIEDVLTMLISLGYIDHQRFLTPDFGVYGDFVLPKKSYSSLQRDLYIILKQHLFEVVTTFDILASLDVIEVNKKLLVKTLSDEPVKADIKLYGLGMQFLNKHYASLQPVVTEEKSRLILEGSQKDVNKALEMLVVNLENVMEWGGTIAISDHLNPTVTKAFTNMSEFFKVNEKPTVKVPIQPQIDAWDLYTGVHFAINLSNETFVDRYNAGLSYHLEMEDPAKTLPTWISFGDDMILKGTPPEEFFYQEMRFSLLVKNEFKGIEAPFKLKIKLSWAFGLKLLVKNSPYILTLIGLIVYANKIYNIVFKKRYRYPKDFYLKIGQEMGGEGIPPIVFLFQEKKESEMILKELRKIVSPGNNGEFALYFVKQDAGRIDRLKMDEKIKEVATLENMTKKLHCYVKGSEVSKRLINQLIFDQLTLWFLEEVQDNKETKKIFDDIKEKWVDLVDWDVYGMCKINESKLSKQLLLLEKTTPQNGSYSLMTEEVNVDLLKDAIEGYALMKQSVNHRAIEAHIIIREKVEDRNVIFRFMKDDLVNVNFSDKGKIGYGMCYKIQNDVLSFYGVPEEKFTGKTIVVQITNRKHRILNEIWIHGENAGGLKKGEVAEVSEDLARGENYEIY